NTASGGARSRTRTSSTTAVSASVNQASNPRATPAPVSGATDPGPPTTAAPASATGDGSGGPASAGTPPIRSIITSGSAAVGMAVGPARPGDPGRRTANLTYLDRDGQDQSTAGPRPRASGD